MKVLLHSIMIFLGTRIAAALVALGESAGQPFSFGPAWLSPLRAP
jgi:hypothetical protein